MEQRLPYGTCPVHTCHIFNAFIGFSNLRALLLPIRSYTMHFGCFFNHSVLFWWRYQDLKAKKMKTCQCQLTTKYLCMLVNQMPKGRWYYQNIIDHYESIVFLNDLNDRRKIEMLRLLLVAGCPIQMGFSKFLFLVSI